MLTTLAKQPKQPNKSLANLLDDLEDKENGLLRQPFQVESLAREKAELKEL
jgi:hypothetical protein